MRPNRSIPRSTVIPVLIYPDVREAVDWLCAAFGFVERVRIGENHRAQLTFGDGAVIDAQFNTTDVCVVVKTDLVTEKYYRHYERSERRQREDAAA